MNIELNIKTLIVKKPLKLDCGKVIKDFPIAYETFGSLNEKKDNAILAKIALSFFSFNEPKVSYAIGKSLMTFPQSNFSGFLTIKVFIFSSIFIIIAAI